MQVTKGKENTARHMARRRGYRLLKSKRQDRLALDHGEYRVIDQSTNKVVMRSRDLAAVVEFLGGYTRQPRSDCPAREEVA